MTRLLRRGGGAAAMQRRQGPRRHSSPAAPVPWAVPAPPSPCASPPAPLTAAPALSPLPRRAVPGRCVGGLAGSELGLGVLLPLLPCLCTAAAPVRPPGALAGTHPCCPAPALLQTRPPPSSCCPCGRAAWASTSPPPTMCSWWAGSGPCAAVPAVLCPAPPALPCMLCLGCPRRDVPRAARPAPAPTPTHPAARHPPGLQMEPALNPALEAQAIGRAWRMGQQRSITVKRFYVQGSIEERIMVGGGGGRGASLPV